MIEPVEKINILFHKKFKKEILDFFQREGIVEIIKEDHFLKKEEKERIIIENEKINAQAKKAESKYVLDFLLSFQEKEKKSFQEKLKEALPDLKIFLTEKEMKEKVKNLNFVKIVEECKRLEAKINKLNNILESLEEKKDLCKKWKKFPFKMRELNRMEDLKVIAGATSKWNDFKGELEKNLKLFDLKVFQQSNNPNEEIKFLLFYHFKIEEKIREIINKFNIEPNKEIENLKETPKEEEKKINKKIKNALREKKITIKRINEMFFLYTDDLKIMYDYLNWEERKKEIDYCGDSTDCIISLKGWIEKSKIAELKNGLEKITDNFEILKLKPGKGEKSPVIISNKKILKPIGIISDMYGTPNANEINPLPPMAPFFVLFFALCLGDVGYGLLLILFSFFGIKVMKAQPEKRDFFNLLIYVGAASCVIGALFGGWFGIDINSLSDGAVKSALLTMKVIDPIANPLQMLFLSLGLGFFQIILAIFLKMYWRIKTSGFKEGFLEEFPIIYLIFSLLLFGIFKAGIIFQGTIFINYIVLSAVLFFVAAKGRKNKNFIMKILGGIGGLYGMVGYFSDIVSYSRLLALGLATGVIASVVNLIAGIVGDMIPLIGFAVSIFILIFGHLFNLMISGFGAFIHSMRLQFVEFFPKFIIGGGKVFNPFTKEGKYVEIEHP